ncbi:hypothetical protein M9H77_31886 [Catharanthus roseus]|uniref:Uncharacterized protein n=1 Tax=Catharanthus roseus TaxID=4058 RepID=A0ACC0A1Q2_CATRO|nr:hypothetical protein M9H77_31886 [Catharanthus roseus]
MTRREATKDFGKSIVNVTVEVVGKGSPPDKLYRYFLVENEYEGDFISCEKITILDSLRSCVAGKKSLVNEVVDSTDRYSYAFKLFMSDDNIARGTVLTIWIISSTLSFILQELTLWGTGLKSLGLSIKL